nr:hypothetical protein [Tanacetum cinerariifolium]
VDDAAAAVEENVAKNVSHAAIPSPPPHDIPSPSQDPYSSLNNNKCVKNLENDNAAQKLVIVKLKARVKKLEKANKIKSSKLRRLRKVGASRRVKSSIDMDDVFNQGRMINDMDMNEGIELVKDAEVAESEGRHAAQQVEKQAKIYNLDLDYSSKVLSMQEDDSEVQEVVEVVTTAKLITEVVTAVASQVSAASTTIPAASDKGKGILVETPKPIKKKDQIEMDAEYARKLQEEIDNKPRAYETHQFYISFTTLLKNFDREDLETLWRIVKDRFSTSKPTNFSDEYLLLTLKTMFKEPDRQDAIWRNQKSVHGLALVKRWEAADFMWFTLEQLVNVTRLQVEKESKMSLELLREEMEKVDEEIIKNINETPAQKAAKRRKLSEEAQEVDDLRKRLEIVQDEDDDVFVQATTLA